MANSLDKNLAPGTVVILRKDFFTVEDLRFQVTNGYGLCSFTGGTALFGIWLEDGENDRLNGYDIDDKATVEYWDKIGFDADASWENYLNEQRKKSGR
jgi:hypothetical protein